MARITYKNRLKKGQTLQDFRAWMDKYRTEQQSWGAENIDCRLHSEQDADYIICQIRVKQIGRWIKSAKNASQHFTDDMDKIMETGSLCIEHRED